MNPSATILTALAGIAVVYLLWTYWSGASVSDLNLTTLGPSQIAALAGRAGFTGDDLTTAVAIALAESRGNPNAYNPETAAGTPEGQGSYGLWQIYLKAHPEFAGQNLNDPQTNANAAYQIYLARGMAFSDWSTFKNGDYAQYLPVAQAVIA